MKSESVKLYQVPNYKSYPSAGLAIQRMELERDKNMIRILPVFKGYTVDMRLQEFRKVPLNDLPEFVSFLSDKGARLFYEFRQTEEGQKELDHFLGRD